MDISIYVEDDGTIQFIYDDLLADLFHSDEITIERASHVEPHPLGGGWIADMGPVNGPILGANGTFGSVAQPFIRRADALAAERRWLEEQLQTRALAFDPWA